jgi:hypothetical protein
MRPHEWQEANRSFWESNPMRYDWKKEIEYEEDQGRFLKRRTFFEEFFEEFLKSFLKR